METILTGKWYLFPSRSLDVSHFVMEIIWCPGQCNQTVETDALRLHWELIFWVWFDLGRLLRETVSISFSLLKVFMLFAINLFTLSLGNFIKVDFFVKNNYFYISDLIFHNFRFLKCHFIFQIFGVSQFWGFKDPQILRN